MDIIAHEFVKTGLPAPLCTCVPLFGCNRAIERNINQFMLSFDAKLIKKYHIPAFAYFGVGGNIVGCAFDDDVVVSDAVHYRDMVGNTLRRCIARVR